MGSKKSSKEVTIKNVPTQMKRELKNISDWTGDSMSALLRPKVRELIESYPEQYREDMID